jgi:hypothetical protein
MSDYRRGSVLDIGLIDHFSIQHIVTLNNNTIADFNTLQVFKPPVSSVVVAWHRLLTIAIPLLPGSCTL